MRRYLHGGLCRKIILWTVIELLLYKYCVSVHYVWTSKCHYKRKSYEIRTEIEPKKEKYYKMRIGYTIYCVFVFFVTICAVIRMLQQYLPSLYAIFYLKNGQLSINFYVFFVLQSPTSLIRVIQIMLYFLHLYRYEV